MTRRLAPALALILGAGACDVGSRPQPDPQPPPAVTPVVAPVMSLVTRLQAQPTILPAVPPEATPVVMLTVWEDAAGVHVDGPPIPVAPSSLRFERAMAARRSTAPPYWAVQSLAGKVDPVYWTPIDPAPKARISVPVAGGGMHGGLRVVPEMVIAVRVPFYAASRLHFTSIAGKASTSYTFGVTPVAPLTPAATP